jgi:hydroxymethylglutaryl-CoA lyase
MTKIVEVGPRDGLQNETVPIPTEVKVAFIDALSSSGVGEIEVSAFVSPHRVPQLSDAEEVFRRISRSRDVVYSALVPNEKGLDRALEARVDKIAVFTGVSETFNRKNIHASFEESLQRFHPVVKRARREGIPVRGYVSTAFWCAYEGKMAPQTAVDAIVRLVDIDVEEVSVSDTVGKASPEEVEQLLDLLLPRLSSERIAMHFHDTFGRAVENVLASYAYGIRTFDASAGGLGGCPFAPGATGNVSTEDVVTSLESTGEPVGVDRRKLSRARSLLDPFLHDEKRELPEEELPGCAACLYATGDICCKRREARG